MTWANGKSICRKLASLTSMMLVLVMVTAFPVQTHAQEKSSNEFETIELLSQKGLSVKSISLGNTFSGALMDDGSLWMWGDNSFGQLGDGTTDERHEPVMIIESGVQAISLGSFHSAALMDDGSLWTWGANTYGQLGDGTTTDRHEPVMVIESNVDVVTLGDRYSAAILDDGSLWTWGQNWNGQLGDGTTENRNEPTKVIDNGVKSASIGFSHSAALMEDGSLKMWGSGEFGELGDGLNRDYSKPVTVIASGVQSVAVDSTYSAVVMTDGSLWMFGANDSGQLGDGTIEVRHEPIRIIGSGVTSVSLGGSSSSVVMTDGSLWMWGSNLNGELGDGTTEERHQPVEIIDSGVEAVSLGAFSTAMIKDDGSVWMWGRNDYGQLGDGTTDERHEPVMIFAPTKAPVDPSTIIPAYEPIVHLAASFLTEFNVGTGFEDASVNDYLQSGAFVDRAIWDNSPQTYEDFFSQTVGAYEIVSARVFSYKGAPHIVLKNPVSNDLIVAFSKGGPELLESTGVTTYFNDAASTLSSIGRKFPNSTIYLAGENVGGLAASYLSTATHYRATTFNSPAVASTLLTALTQPVSLSKSNSFRGVDDTYCVNYYTEDYGERLGYSEDIAVSALVNANPLGETDELTAFFEYEDNQYSFCSYALSIPDEMKLFGIEDFDSAADAQLEMYDTSLYEMIKDGSITDKISFPSITTVSDIYTTVALGTVGHDSMRIGVFSGDKSIDIMGHYIDLTGVADSDVMEGGTTSDIFVAGEGSASFKGRAGSDLYFIGDDADVSIHDTGSTSLSNFVDLLKSTYDLVFSMDISAAPDFAESLSNVLSHTNRDAVVFTNCSFDDIEVSFDSDGNNYIIEAGTSVVTVPKRSQDFYIVDASGQTVADGMMLDDLYALKQGVNSTSIAPMSVDEEDYSEYVSFYIGGDDAAVRLTDVESGEELRTIAVGDTSGIVDVCLDHGTFVIDGTGKTIDGLYDSSKIKAEIIGDCDEVIANDVVGSVEGDLAAFKDVGVTGFDDGKVEIRTEKNVRLIGVKDGAEVDVPVTVVDNPLSPNDTPENPDPDTPDVPNPPSGNQPDPVQTFPPVISKVQNGSVTVTPTNPKEGDRVTISASPENGFMLSGISVTDSTGEQIDITANEDGTWAFKQPGEKVTITATFACNGGDLCPSHRFTDIGAATEWYHSAIDWAVSSDVLHGIGGTTLMQPNRAITRAELATVLCNIEEGKPGNKAILEKYSDADSNAWYAPTMSWAIEEGLFYGWTDGKQMYLQPDREITREETAAVLMRWTERNGSGVSDGGDLSKFPDAQEVSAWATSAMQWAVESGVLQGVEQSDGTRLLEAHGTASRAQVAALMQRLTSQIESFR